MQTLAGGATRYLRAHLLGRIPDPDGLDVAANEEVTPALLPFGNETGLTVLTRYNVGQRTKRRYQVDTGRFVISINPDIAISCMK
jgi:hypothetical protein